MNRKFTTETMSMVRLLNSSTRVVGTRYCRGVVRKINTPHGCHHYTCSPHINHINRTFATTSFVRRDKDPQETPTSPTTPELSLEEFQKQQQLGHLSPSEQVNVQAMKHLAESLKDETFRKKLVEEAKVMKEQQMRAEEQNSEGGGGEGGGPDDSSRMLTWRELIAWALTGCVIAGAYFGDKYNRQLKEQKRKKEKEIENKRKMGNANVGGSLAGLEDHHGNIIRDDTFLGKWIILYFGFCHCPDICPDKMETLAEAVDVINAMDDVPNITPLFITVDPKRDTKENIKKYLADFHPDFIGLRGDEEQIKKIGKAYHVYQSLGEVDEDGDYIVDHTVVIYLMDADGKFSDYYGRSCTTETVVRGVRLKMDMAAGRV